MITWGQGEVGGGEEVVQGNFGGDGYHVDCGDSFNGANMSKFIKSYSLNMCN